MTDPSPVSMQPAPTSLAGLPPLVVRGRRLLPVVQRGVGVGIAKIGPFCIDTQLAAAVRGDVAKGLFFRGAAADRPGRLVLAVPHRFFFLVGVVQLAQISLWWIWALAARAWPTVPAPGAAVPETSLHALLMLCGFAPFFMFGFLFTAGPRWLGVTPPPPSAWRLPGILAAVAALALVPLEVAGPAPGAAAVRIAAGAYVVGWLWLAHVFARLIRASAAADRLHASLVLAGLCAGAGAVAAFATFGPAAHPWVKGAGLWAFLLPVFVTVCHRMIPFFTAGVAPFVTAFRPPWLLALLIGAPLAHGALDGGGLAAWTWAVDLPAAAMLLWLTTRWGLAQSMRNRLLAMLHLGFVWYGLAFMLAGVHSLLVGAGGTGIALAPLHAFTIGFASSLLMAMVTRVTRGHSGGTLAADSLTWGLFLLLQVAAVARIAADLLPGSGWLVLAGVLWAAAFVPWCASLAPVYWRPRVDGRPG
jgi:uncharacterized protein involved in response to NO